MISQTTSIRKLFWIFLLFPLFVGFTLAYSNTIDLLLLDYVKDKPLPSWAIYMYHFGCYPMIIIGGFSLVLGIYWYKRGDRSKTLLYFIYPLTLVIGAGIIVNGLKETWGRPRPIKVVNQEHLFVPFYKPEHSSGKSFPSGHAACGFSLFTLMWIGLQQQRLLLFILGISTSFIFGGLLAYSRILALGHFYSDVIVSFLIMYYLPPLLILIGEKKWRDKKL